MLVQIETQNYGNGITDKEIGISPRYFISYAIQIFHKNTQILDLIVISFKSQAEI